MEDDTRIVDLTVGELRELIAATIGLQTQRTYEEVTAPTKDLRYGISGLADLLGCSKRYAQELKSKGIFDSAITQVGRKIIINADKALELYATLKNG